MDMRIIAAPVIGAIIGYITNDIAIKMLFRPSTPKYIGKFRIPLTPGLIPKEKARLAQSIGDVVGRDLLNEQALRDAFLSEEMRARFRAAVKGALERGAASDKTLIECLRQVAGGEQADQLAVDARAFIAGYMADRIKEADIGSTAAHSIGDGLKKKTPGGLSDFLGNLFDGKLKEGAKHQIRDAVNGYIDRHAEAVIAGAVDREAEKLLAMRVCDLAEQHRDKMPALLDRLESLYEKIMTDGLHKLLGAIDLAGIVRGRIESIDNRDLEKMIFAVVDKELKAIVYLGALLGFFMGFVTLIF